MKSMRLRLIRLETPLAIGAQIQNGPDTRLLKEIPILPGQQMKAVRALQTVKAGDPPFTGIPSEIPAVSGSFQREPTVIFHNVSLFSFPHADDDQNADPH